MKTFDKLKLAVFEANKDELIDNEITEQMVNFCENADINDPDDRAIAGEILDTLMALSESVEDNEPVMDDEPVMTKDEIRLQIFESEHAGDITKEEMKDLLERLDSIAD